MKTIKLIIIGILLFGATTAKAQVSINVNIGRPPAWGPVGYDDVAYYFLPDIQIYYDIRNAEYIYSHKGRWIRSRKLPGHCRNYDLYRGYKVPLTDYRGNTPYAYYYTHKVKYYKGYKGKPQKARGYYKDENRYEDRQDNRRDHHYERGYEKHHDKRNHGKDRD